MSALLHLKACTSTAHLAHLIGFQPKALAYLGWGMPSGAKYVEFEIPKRSGGLRIIHAPAPQLKQAQQRIGTLLQKCEREIEENLGVRKRVAHGFKKDHSILTNAAVHRGQRYVLNFDLEDFFGAINFGRVRGFFVTNRNWRLHPDVATLIAQVSCFQNKLPQGSPTSPVISNLIGNILDVRLAKIARASGCSYSRYADDITISTSLPSFPEAVAVPVLGSPRWVLSDQVQNAVHGAGFRINESKTRLLDRQVRQDVTGIVTNQVVNVNSDYRRKARAMVHRLRSTGKFIRTKSQLDGAGSTTVVEQEGSWEELRGILSFVLQVERFRLGTKDPTGPLTSNERLFRQFLFYTTFANSSKPVVLFEGKTDNIYVATALRSLSASYLGLMDAGSDTFRIRLLSSTKSVVRMFGLSGGETQLKEFVKKYDEEYRQITGPKGALPVIAVFDNDSGGLGVVKLLKNYFKIKVANGAQFVRVRGNLYVAFTSPLGGPAHCIEDCFDSATRSRTLNGKTFNPSNKSLGPMEYGKAYFAEKVVKQNAKDIDFSGFAPLLNLIAEIISTHTPSSAPAPLP